MLLNLASVPVVEVVCTDEEAVLLRIAMNKLRGELNLATVASQLADLRAGGMAMEELVAAGYTSTGIDELLAMVAPDDPEQALAQMGSADEAEADAKVADSFQQLQLDLRITRREFLKVKRRLKKLGDGDMGDGLLKLLNAEEES
jgi:ParB-like chromosome segregation protein Spo0J